MTKLTENGAIDWEDEEHVAHFNSERRRFEDLSHRRATEANESERSLCAQLMLLGTVLITVTGVILAEAADDPTFSLVQRLLAVAALVLLAKSVFSGIAYYFGMIKHFLDWGNAEYSIVDHIQDRNYLTNAHLGKLIKAAYGDLPITQSPKDLKRQVSYLKYAFIAYLILVVAFLFDFGLTRAFESLIQ